MGTYPAPGPSLRVALLGLRRVRVAVPANENAEELRGLLRLGVVVGLAHDLLLLVHRRLGPQQRRAQPLLVLLVLRARALLAHFLAALLLLVRLEALHEFRVHRLRVLERGEELLQALLDGSEHLQVPGVVVRVEAAGPEHLRGHALQLLEQVRRAIRTALGVDAPAQRVRLVRLLRDLALRVGDVLAQLVRAVLLGELGLRELLLNLLELLLRLLAVLDEEEVLLLELREDVQELLRVLEVERQLLAAVLVLPVLLLEHLARRVLLPDAPAPELQLALALARIVLLLLLLLPHLALLHALLELAVHVRLLRGDLLAHGLADLLEAQLHVVLLALAPAVPLDLHLPRLHVV